MDQQTSFHQKVLPNNLILQFEKHNVKDESKLLQEAKELLKESKRSKLDDLINKCNDVNIWISISFLLENHFKNHDLEQVWLSGLKKFNKNEEYLQALSYYYFRSQKFDSCLQYGKKSLQLKDTMQVKKLMILAAYEILQFHLVIDYYEALRPQEQDTVEEKILNKVGNAALQEKQYLSAGIIFAKLQSMAKGKSLRTLDETLIDTFGSAKKIKAWQSAFQEKIHSSAFKETRVNECVDYASILMSQNKFKEAYDHLLKAKKFFFA